MDSSSTIQSIRDRYGVIVPDLQKDFKRANIHSVPRIRKIVVNVGLGRFLKDDNGMREVIDGLTAITGQKPVMRRSRKAVSGFKIREGMDVGSSVTLRGQRMWDFLNRLVHVSMPRVRDFQGIPVRAVDTHGNIHIGFRDHTIFPEIVPEHAKIIFGFQVTIVTEGLSGEEGVEFYRRLGFPLEK
ncbi:MAG: 50S ribosomal protein L5 [Candidatus Moranbacteria bacterium]|nr:50S ribosomal protein L5 [Candidatus Moranbacteria bacterium]